jgi:hypothetical protein
MVEEDHGALMMEAHEEDHEMVDHAEDRVVEEDHVHGEDKEDILEVVEDNHSHDCERSVERVGTHKGDNSVASSLEVEVVELPREEVGQEDNHEEVVRNQLAVDSQGKEAEGLVGIHHNNHDAPNTNLLNLWGVAHWSVWFDLEELLVYHRCYLRPILHQNSRNLFWKMNWTFSLVHITLRLFATLVSNLARQMK